MQKQLKIRDITLRDGQQSQFATRMSQAQIDGVLADYREAHFYALEVWAEPFRIRSCAISGKIHGNGSR